MLQEVIELETLRQKIQTEDDSQADTSDIDRGQPKEKSAALQNKIAGLKSQLHDLIADTRKTNPLALEEWIALHTSILSSFLTEKPGDMNAGTRRMFAEHTLQAWEKVRSGEQDYVYVNWRFLEGYREELRNRLRKNAGSWWKIRK